MSKVKYLILFIISLIVLLFTFNNDRFYKEDILKITNIDVKSTYKQQNDLGLTEEYKVLNITGIYSNGKNKGTTKSFEYESSSSSVVTTKFKVGDKVFIKHNNIDDLKRDYYVVFMFVVFINLIFLVGSFSGLLSVFSVLLNIIIFYLGLSLYFRGINIIFICIIESILFSILSLFIASGINKKTLSAVISVFICTVFIIVLSNLTRLFGINYNELKFLTVPPEEILVVELLIGSVGAIMDVCITICSSVAELIDKNNKISIKELNNSCKNIGKDIMSTMTNVLFFTYLAGGLPIFVLATRNGFSVYNYLVTNFSLELTRFLIGAIGIVISIPISTFVSIKLFKRGEINE